MTDYTNPEKHQDSRQYKMARELERLREFYEAWWVVEQGVAEFDLHADAVERLSKAHAEVIKLDRAKVGHQAA